MLSGTRKTPCFWRKLGLAAVTLLYVSIVSTNGQNRPLSEQIQSLLVQADTLKSSANYSEAIRLYTLVIKEAETVNNASAMAQALNGIGQVHFFQGKYIQALETYKQSLALSQQANDERQIAYAQALLGQVYWRLYKYEDSIAFCQKAIAQFETLNDKRGLALALRILGRLCNGYQVGSYNNEKAIACHQRSLELSREIGDVEGTAYALKELGVVYMTMRPKQPEQALDYFQQVLKLVEKSPYRRLLGVTLLNIGTCQEQLLGRKYYPHSGQVTVAEVEPIIALEERAAAIFEEIDEPDELHEIYDFIARIYGFMGHLSEIVRMKSLAMHDKAIAVTRRLMRQNASNVYDVQKLFTGYVDRYVNKFTYLYGIKRPNEAFSTFEQMRAQTLLEMLNTSRHPNPALLTEQERQQEAHLRQEIILLNQQIERQGRRKNNDEANSLELGEKLQQARLAYEDFQTRLYAEHPEWQLAQTEVKPISVEEAVLLLPDDKTAFLLYCTVWDDTVWYSLVLTRDREGEPETKGEEAFSQKVTVRSPQGNTVTATLKGYYWGTDRDSHDLQSCILKFRDQLTSESSDFRPLARELYDRLLSPARQQLSGRTNLIIVPDGPLWELPFQALITEDDHYLVEDAAISYVPSLTALREMSREERASRVTQLSNRTLFALGNPALATTTVNRVRHLYRSGRLDPLPDAETEIRDLQTLYGRARSKTYKGEQASEAIFKAEADKYRIIHLATHGRVNEMRPIYSHLVLAQGGQSSSEDGLLEAWEIMKLKLNAEMVVLSACETGRGKVSSGEGMIGLSWAFFLAGVPTTVVSQWKVDSAATATLMVEFHRQWQQRKQTKAEALRQAALRMLKDPLRQRRHPFYWAGFIVAGNGQ